MKKTIIDQNSSIIGAPPVNTIANSVTTTENQKSGGCPWFDEDAHNDKYDINPDSTTRCRNWDELMRRESYKLDTHVDGEANPEIKKFDFGPLGDLPCVRIGDHAWCSLSGGGRIAGRALHQMTGFMPDMSYFPVRGEPNFLEPNEIRCLYPQGIPDMGIRLEALVSCVNPNRCEGKLMKHLVQRVLPVMYPAEESFFIRNISSEWPYPENPRDPCAKFRQYRYYDDVTGEFRMVAIGTRVWINVADLSRRTRIEERVISWIAGSARSVKVPNSEIHDADEPGGVASFVTSDAACALLNAMDLCRFEAAPLDRWVSKELLTPEAQLESGRCMHASSLHRVLGNDREYPAWVTEIRRNHPTLLRHLGVLTNLESGDDFEIPLTEAYAIATGESGYCADLCRTLIRDGGFLHHGPLTESMDATFERLKGLMPDPSGLVSARAVHAFLGESRTFEDWMRQLEPICTPPEFITLIDHEMMSADLAYRGGLQYRLLSIYER